MENDSARLAYNLKKCAYWHRRAFNKMARTLANTSLEDLKIYGYAEYRDGRPFLHKHYKIWIDIGLKSKSAKIDNIFMTYFTDTNFAKLTAQHYKVKQIKLEEIEPHALDELENLWTFFNMSPLEKNVIMATNRWELEQCR